MVLLSVENFASKFPSTLFQLIFIEEKRDAKWHFGQLTEKPCASYHSFLTYNTWHAPLYNVSLFGSKCRQVKWASFQDLLRLVLPEI
jgi:hypothetical protein